MDAEDSPFTALGDEAWEAGSWRKAALFYGRALDGGEVGPPITARLIFRQMVAEANSGAILPALRALRALLALPIEEWPSDVRSQLPTAEAALLHRAGQPEEADRAAQSYGPVALASGYTSGSAMLRFGAAFQAAVARPPGRLDLRWLLPALPPPPSQGGAAGVLLIACDSAYFERYGPAAWTALRRQDAGNTLLHVHLCAPTPAAQRLALALAKADPLLRFTTSPLPGGLAAGEPTLVYYTCLRFLVLPALQQAYQRPILITDADLLAVAPLDDLWRAVEGKAAALIAFPKLRMNLWAWLTASVVVVPFEGAGQRFATLLRAYIEAQIARGLLLWHLDQAALAAVTLNGGLEIGFLAPEVMDAAPWGPEDGGNAAEGSRHPAGTAVFWSITGSRAEHVHKLDSAVFRDLDRRPPPVAADRPLVVLSPAVPPDPMGQAAVLGRLLDGRPALALRFVTAGLPAQPTQADGAVWTFQTTRPPAGWVEALGAGEAAAAGYEGFVAARAAEILALVGADRPCALLACTADPLDLPAATLVARALGIPLVVYLFDDPVFQWPDSMAVVRAGAERWARVWTREAAEIIAPNPLLADGIAARYGRRPIVVLNGSLTPLNREPPPPWPAPPAALSLVFTGSIYHAQADALGRVVAALDRLAGRWQLHLYTPQDTATLRGLGLTGPHVFPHAAVTAQAVVPIQRAAEALVLPLAFTSGVPEVVRTAAPGKLGDYLMSGRPILVHAPADSYAARLFAEEGCGAVVGIADVDRLVETLTRLDRDEVWRQSLIDAARRVAPSYGMDVARCVFWERMDRLLAESSLGEGGQ
ncbi:hypothetical protein F11_14065 [Rhodospirillum rubrum F11]|nr:hypothetical protein F11_14065 [Rhodospirillum rubrum F11]